MSGVLIDTSVWVDHFRRRNDTLAVLLEQDLALSHAMVIGEIACGTPPAPRAQTLDDLGLLPLSQQAGVRETIGFIEREGLYGTGCGLVDLVLLASTLMTPGAKLWSLDRRLDALAQRFGVAFRMAVP